MIKLTRAQKPDFLDEETVQELTDKYAETRQSVWNKKQIKAPLLASSSDKCAYCEVNIAEESKYMEVEHFRHKDEFPEMVVEWENLLPSCKRCNGRKGTYNVETDGMILNPYDADPSAHMFFKDYRLRWRTELGRRTIIDALYLNDSQKLVGVRLKVGEAICEALEGLRADMEEYQQGNQTARKWAKIKRGVERLLREAQPSAAFSAVAATVLLSDPDYVWIRDTLEAYHEWADLEELEENARTLMLDF